MNTNIPNTLPKLDFNITNRCNFRCRHCCFKSGEVNLEEFSYKKIVCILKEFKSLGGRRFDITGGEALVRTDVGKIIKAGKDLDLKIELVTNGSLLTDEKLQRFKKIGLDAVAISLDGSTYGVYRRIRPVTGEIYDTVVANIQKCVQHGFSTKVNVVVFKSNFEDLINIVKKCIAWGVRECGFYYFTPVGRGEGSPDEVVDPVEWLNFIRTELSNFKDRIKISVETPIIEKELILSRELTTSCYLKNPWHLQILPDGNVYPCAIMAFYGKPCGNLYQQTLTEIWRDRKLWDGGYYRDNVLPYFKKCGGCVDYGKDFKELLAEKYQFVCLMCKFKVENICL